MTLGDLKELVEEASTSLYNDDKIEVVYVDGKLQIRKAENAFDMSPKKLTVEIITKIHRAEDIFAEVECNKYLDLDTHRGELITILNFPTNVFAIVSVKDQEGREYSFTNANTRYWKILIPKNIEGDGYISHLIISYYITARRIR